MNMFLNKFYFVLFCLLAHSFAEDLNAIRECGNLHQLEFRNIADAGAEYSNSDCVLRCFVANRTLSNDALNEGFACPLNAKGYCHNGKCVVENSDQALMECGNLHHADFHKTGSGSAFGNDQCSLKCVLNGNFVSENSLNEGYACPNDNSGICRNGHCVKYSTTLPSTTILTTSTPISDNLIFKTHKIDEIRLHLNSASLYQSYYGMVAIACLAETFNPFLDQKNCKKRCLSQHIFTETQQPAWNHLCYLQQSILQSDYLNIHVEYINGSHSYTIGTVVQHLNTLFSRHYQSNDTESRVVHFSFKDKFALLNATNSQIGDIELAFEVKLSEI